MNPLGWWAISGEALLDMLHQVAEGADPDLVYAEHYANSDHDPPDATDQQPIPFSPHQ